MTAGGNKREARLGVWEARRSQPRILRAAVREQARPGKGGVLGAADRGISVKGEWPAGRDDVTTGHGHWVQERGGHRSGHVAVVRQENGREAEESKCE